MGMPALEVVVVPVRVLLKVVEVKVAVGVAGCVVPSVVVSAHHL